jgi:hypothetical protein
MTAITPQFPDTMDNLLISRFSGRLAPDPQARPTAWLEERPTVYGWTGDQVWTPARVRMLIGRKFHISYSVSGVTRLPHPMGCGVQMPGWCTASFRHAVRRHSTELRTPLGALSELGDLLEQLAAPGIVEPGRRRGLRGACQTVSDVGAQCLGVLLGCSASRVLV